MKNKSVILIVEDDLALNEAYKTILEIADYEVYTAFDGKEALQAAEKHSPAIIFLDLRMPVMDGIGFLENYQLKQSHPDVRVVVFSNYDMQAEVDRAYELGAQRYVLKAMASPKDLIKIVKDLS